MWDSYIPNRLDVVWDSYIPNRLDVVWDSYIPDSLKESTRDKRGRVYAGKYQLLPNFLPTGWISCVIQ